MREAGARFRLHSEAGSAPVSSISSLILAADQGDRSAAEALDELAKFDLPSAEVVDLKFFCGFTFAEIAAMRSVTERTAQRQWEKARIYLYRSIRAKLET
jgi:ECF sigma factor